jgi:hypothetical protein
MRTGSNAQEMAEAPGYRRRDEGDEAWFMQSADQLRQRTAREGTWVNHPTRKTVERLIDWLQTE